MATLVVDVQNDIEAGRVADAIRLLKSVRSEGEPGRIPGLAYTRTERMADIGRAEEEYAAGCTIIAEELIARISAW